ncbi:uncharacterized protein ACRADG_002518 isoform 4-T4 [Cochliomyia hominivorax]
MDLRIPDAFYNSDKILENIFKNLELNEQLKCAKITLRFEFIITKIVWPKMYTDLNVYKNRYKTILSQKSINNINEREFMLNNIKEHKIILTEEENYEFFNLNAKNLKALKVISEYYIPVMDIFNKVIYKNLQCENLNELILYRLIINQQHVKSLAKSCQNLKKLELIKCFSDKLNPLIPGENFNLVYLYNLKYLMEFSVKNSKNKINIIKTSTLLEILKNMNLTKLILENFIIFNNTTESTLSISGNNIEVLNIGLIDQSFYRYFVTYLKCFKNLQELYIYVSDCNTIFCDGVMNILRHYCRHLQKLSLQNCDLQVQDFGLLKNLKSLSLQSCGGLTFENLQQIFSLENLISFSLLKSRIYGKISQLFITPALQELIIDTLNYSEICNIFENSLNHFLNLQTLKWLNGDITGKWISNKCPKLIKLHLPNPYNILNLKILKVLTFTSLSGVSWYFIMTLLKSWSLESLIIQNQDSFYDKVLPQDREIKTSLKFILLPYQMFKMAPNFWLNLWYFNQNLSYMIYGKREEILNGDFLERFVSSEDFYRRAKCIRILGFKLMKS